MVIILTIIFILGVNAVYASDNSTQHIMEISNEDVHDDVSLPAGESAVDAIDDAQSSENHTLEGNVSEDALRSADGEILSDNSNPGTFIDLKYKIETEIADNEDILEPNTYIKLEQDYVYNPSVDRDIDPSLGVKISNIFSF